MRPDVLLVSHLVRVCQRVKCLLFNTCFSMRYQAPNKGITRRTNCDSFPMHQELGGRGIWGVGCLRLLGSYSESRYTAVL